MTHIKTASDAETSMRKTYKTVTEEGSVKADASHLQLIKSIIANTQQVDLLKLEISEAMGKLMGVIQGHASMKDDTGKVRVSWENAGDKEVIDYDGLIFELNVPPATIAKHTFRKPGARIFKVFE